MRDFDFYEVVEILPSPNAVALGVGNARGIVVGIAGEANGKTYAIHVDDQTLILDPSELAPTGERVDRDALYGGESIRVPPGRYHDNES